MKVLNVSHVLKDLCRKQNVVAFRFQYHAKQVYNLLGMRVDRIMLYAVGESKLANVGGPNGLKSP
jgi:hypothetical protein